jgi:hypothetical protein
MMISNRDSAIQSAFKRFCLVYKSENSAPCQPSGRRVIPSGRPSVQSIGRPDEVSYLPDSHLFKASSVQTFPCVEKFRTAPACIRPDVSAARPDDTQCSTSFRISFQNIVMGRLLQPSGRRGFLSGPAHP